MDFWAETNWFAVQTTPQHEKVAASNFARLDVEVFLPRIRREQLVGGVPRLVTRPLFVGYFFARFCPLISWDAVRYARGIVRVVGTGRWPIPLEDEIISSLRDRVQTDGFIRFQAKPFVAGDQVTIEQGPFAGWMGEVEQEWNDGRRVLLLLNSIQQARVLVNKLWLATAEVN